MNRRRACLYVLVALCTVAPIRPAAQSPPQGQPPPGQQTPPTPAPPQQPTFRTRIDSVSVDVMVTDKQGRPVTDLTADDFEVRESNKPQTIETFKFVRVDDPTVIEPTTNHEIHSQEDQERETARGDVRLVVIFLDDYHVRKENGRAMRPQIAKFVSGLGPHDLVAIMYPLLPVSALTFSYNQDTTAQAVNNFEGRKYDYTPRNAYEDRLAYQPPEVAERTRNEITLSALESLCTYLGSLKDERKTVLFVSEGMSASPLPAGVNAKGSLMPPSGLATQPAMFDQMEMLDRMRQVFKAASRSNTSVYTLDPRGLATTEYQIDDTVGLQADRQTLGEMMNMLRTIADNTGGRAIVNRNDTLPELRQMVREMSAYYLLGYTSSLAPRDGKFHDIQVRVKRKDVEVRARKGYYAYSADEVTKMSSAGSTPKVGPPADVEDALTAIEPTRGHAVRIWMASERGASGKAKLTLAWEAADAIGGAPADAVDHITVTANSIYGDMLFRGPVPRDPQAGRAAGLVTFDAPAGAVRVQVVAENARGQRIDHSDQDVEVPDFTAVGPTITLPAVFRARTARDVQQLRAAPAPVPTITRQFSRAERLLLRFQVYGPAGTTPPVTMRFLNQLGQSMAALPAPTRAADGTFEADVSLGSLAPGDYIIEIASAAETGTAKRLVAIRVTG
jgi:VWFA-related protein